MATLSTEPTAITGTVANPGGAFYPEMDLAALGAARNLLQTDAAVITEKATLALLDINDVLATWRAEQELAGVTALTTDQQTRYTAAAYDQTMGRLVQTMPQVQGGGTARSAAKEENRDSAAWFASARYELAHIMGQTGVGRAGSYVALI